MEKDNKIESNIIETFKEVFESQNIEFPKDFSDESILLDSGLDSLGFAIIVSVLEEKLGYDPFIEMEEAYYPSSYKDFKDIYLKYSHLLSC
jgi:acyl carrier protein|tara:strand:+ start:11597 stop:11869 length:273 start_codon:yes stop_codon:yes gene_type:complete